MNAAPIKQVSCLNIEISENGLAEFNGGSRIVFIPKETFKALKLALAPVPSAHGCNLLLG